MKGMVVAPEPLAAEAGAEALRKGGNAADAAVAAAFAQCVVNPLFCGIGGTALGLVRRGPDGPIRVLDASSTIGSIPPPADWERGYLGRAETIGRYIVRGEINQLGYASVMLPSFVRGAQVLFESYGSGGVSWSDLIAPAVRLAEDGFEIYPFVARLWADTDDRPGYPGLTKKFACTPECARIYLRHDGQRYQQGDRLIQRDLAQTLRRIANEGADDFYEGEIGRRIAEDFAQNHGLITAEDLRSYQPQVYDPIEGHYRGYQIVSVPPSGSGAQLIEMMQIAEAMDLGSLDHNGPDYLDLMARIMVATFIEHAILRNDPPLSIGTETLRRALDPGHARTLAGELRAQRPTSRAPMVTDVGTTHVTVVDTEGTLVSFTHSIGALGGSGVVTPGLGILFNNFIGHFNPLPGHSDSIAKQKRGGGGCAAIVFETGQPRVVIGAPGGSRLISSIFQVLLNVLDRRMEMGVAVTVPRFHCEEPSRMFVEPTFPEAMVQALRNRGYRVEVSTYMARIQAILVDKGGQLHAGADPRAGAGAVSVDS